MEEQEKEQKKEKKGSWGGRRAGAGRPNVHQSIRTITLRIPGDVADIIDRHKNRTAYIIEAIRTYDREHGSAE